MFTTLLKTAAASAVMAIAIRAAVWASEGMWRGSTIVCALVVFGGIALGAGLTWAFFRVLRVEELPELESAAAGLGRRLGLKAR
jgi:hypothetical protein